MDRAEARGVALGRLEELRALSYEELLTRFSDRLEACDVIGRSGARYQLEAQVLKEGRGESLRVMVSVDDGGVRAFSPLTESFIITPEGSFVGE